MQQLEELRRRLREVYDLRGVASLLWWDQSTYMPARGAEGRGRQLATLERLAHEKFTDPVVGELLESLAPHERELEYDSDEAALIRVTRREYEKQTTVPPEFVARFSEHSSASYAAWRRARPEDDFATVRSYLERTLELSRKYAGFFPEAEHMADPLIQWSDPSMTTETVRTVFSELRARLVPLVCEVSERPQADDSCLRQHFDEGEQLLFAEEVASRFGYDFSRGRHDLTTHPFATTISWGDVRITTRVKENDLRRPLFSTLHEAGHGMYEQGVDKKFEGTPLAAGTSEGVHESQSRLWENLVGCGRECWEYFYPELRRRFPAQLGSVSLEEFYRAINGVEPSLIRTEADELTYDLHVIMRFDFELMMLEGSLEIQDLPEAWRNRVDADLGVVVRDDRDGCLQDAHWFNGTIGGMFQSYTLGNILSAQFYAAALKACPEIPARIAEGDFGPLHWWLVKNIYRHGSKYDAEEIIQKAAGSPMSIQPYVDYLSSKYGQLYDLQTR